VLDGDLIAKETGRAGAGVGYQRLFLREFQLEFILQERSQSLLDLLGFSLGPGEPEQMIICVSAISQTPKSRIIWVGAGQPDHLPP